MSRCVATWLLWVLWSCELALLLSANFMFYIGGGAINGGVLDGRYFLAEHGEMIVVSRAVWRLTLAMELAMITLLPTTGVLALIFGLPGPRQHVSRAWSRLLQATAFIGIGLLLLSAFLPEFYGT